MLTALGLAAHGEPAVSTPAAGQPAAAAPQTVAHLHWLGEKRLRAETNAAGFMSVWELPESQRLVAQTLDKLALALAGTPVTNFPAPTNYESFVARSAVAAPLRPLLADVVREEAYLEVRQASGAPAEFALALRLTDEQAAVWDTNLSRALAALPGARPQPAQTGVHTWQLSPGHHLSLARSGHWTIVGLAPEPNALLLHDFLARLQHDPDPFKPDPLNFWLYGEFELARIAADLAWSWNPPPGWPKVSLGVMGDGQTVKARAELAFPKPVPGHLDPWILPTDFVYGPFSAFTAVRGLKPWLESLPAWTRLHAGPPADQFFTWGLQGRPMNTFFAAPHPQAHDQVGKLADLILARSPDWLADHRVARFESTPASHGIEWRGLGYLAPFLQPAPASNANFVLGGFWPLAGATYPFPAELRQLLDQTNVIAYVWDATPPRIDQWIYISQFIRLITQRAQLPASSAGLTWLRAAGPKLGNCACVVTKSGPNNLAFARRSAIGLSALEMHLLAEWLESPKFPRGLFSVLTPAPPDETGEPSPPSSPRSPGAQGAK